jgi:hypothetical protein
MGIRNRGNRRGNGTRIGSRNRRVKWTHRSNLRMLVIVSKDNDNHDTEVKEC